MVPKKKDHPDPPWFEPFLGDVIVDLDVHTKLPSIMLEKLRRALVDNVRHTRPHGKKKWEEIVIQGDLRYALECYPDSEGKIIITGARPANKPKSKKLRR